MLKIPKNIHSSIYYIALSICAFSLSLSVFLISLCQIILLINWLLEEPLKMRLLKIKSCKPLWFIALFFIVHILGLIPTSNFIFAQHDLQIKLPFLMMPFIVGTSEPLDLKRLKFVLISFVTGVSISSLYSAIILFKIQGDVMSQMLIISPFVWHIRLAIMVTFAMFILPWSFAKETIVWKKILYILLFLWFVVFLFILQSLTGILILFALILLFLIIGIFRLKAMMLKWFLTTIGVTAFLLISSYLLHMYAHNFCPLPLIKNNLDKFTENGNPYQNDINPPYLENGNYINIYLCTSELEKEWSKRSAIGINTTDAHNNTIRPTLIRYLTSKGLRKDSAGIAQLSVNDIRNIEMGIANSVYTQKLGLKSRIYRSMWELYHYSKGANPSGYSIALRFEYLKTAVHIICRNFWIGTGTGDVLQEFQNQYNIDHSELSERWRLRAHNQMLTFFLTFGIFGFIIITISIFAPPIITGKYKTYLFAVFLTIFILSMFTDDTLETHAGISFIAIFYSIFLFSEKQTTEI